MGQRRATVARCDAPGCTVERVTSALEPAIGYHLGKGQWATEGGGGPIPAIYACSEEHIAPAVIYVIDGAQHDRF